MGLFDFITGGTPRKKSTSGPHVTRDRQSAERKQRMADTAAAVAKNSAVADGLKADDAAAAKQKAVEERKKKIGDGLNFYKKILKK